MAMRRLLILVSALVWVDTMLYAALTPLLPHFAKTLHLSKAGAGVLVAAYAAGALIGGRPRGAAAARPARGGGGRRARRRLRRRCAQRRVPGGSRSRPTRRPAGGPRRPRADGP